MGASVATSTRDFEDIVVVVDDDEDFCFALERWHQQLIEDGRESRLIVFHTVKKARAFFYSRRKAPKLDVSRLILLLDLDFGGDKLSSYRFLRNLKKFRTASANEANSQDLASIPVIVYSNSDEDEEAERSFKNGANSFVWKGIPDNQENKFRKILEYWFAVQTTPKNFNRVRM